MIPLLQRKSYFQSLKLYRMKNFLLGLFLAFFSFGMVSGQCVSSVYDDFESGSIAAGWTLAGSYTRTVMTSGSPQGSNHLVQTGSSSHYGGLKWSFTPSTPAYMAYWVNSGPSGQSGARNYVVVGDASTSSNNGIMFMYNTGSNTFRFYNGAANYEHATVLNTWYHVEMMNINFTTKTFDLWVDGVLVAPGYAFRSTASTNISQLNLYNLGGNSNGYYDEIIIGTAPLTLSSAVTNPLCNGDTTGMIATAVVSGAVNPVSYLWNTGDTTTSISGLAPGTYSYTATGGNGCTHIDTLTIVEPTALSGVGSSMDATCSYSTDGGITYALSGGTPGYSYLWSNGDTTDTLMNLMPGSYYVDYVDSNGCAGSDTMMVASPMALNFNDSLMNVGCNGDSTGMINLSTTGGTMPYTFLWSNGEMTEDISGLAPGAYNVQVTDTNGCMHADLSLIHI